MMDVCVMLEKLAAAGIDASVEGEGKSCRLVVDGRVVGYIADDRVYLV